MSLPMDVTMEVWRNTVTESGKVVRTPVGTVRGYLFTLSVMESIRQYGELVTVSARFYSLTDFEFHNDDLLVIPSTGDKFNIVSVHPLPKFYFVKYFLELRKVT